MGQAENGCCFPACKMSPLLGEAKWSIGPRGNSSSKFQAYSRQSLGKGLNFLPWDHEINPCGVPMRLGNRSRPCLRTVGAAQIRKDFVSAFGRGWKINIDQLYIYIHMCILYDVYSYIFCIAIHQKQVAKVCQLFVTFFRSCSCRRANL